MSTLKVEYDVYAKLFGKNLIKLNKTVCEKNKISIPIILNGNIDKYNSSSGYLIIYAIQQHQKMEQIYY